MAYNVGDIVELKTESGEFSRFLTSINSGDTAKPVGKSIVQDSLDTVAELDNLSIPTQIVDDNYKAMYDLVASLPIAKKPDPITILNNEVITLSPEQLAEAFWNLDSGEQARFYNHLDTVADFHFPFQLQWITEEDGLTLAGRRVMGCIGEYSHWGLVPKLKYNGEIK